MKNLLLALVLGFLTLSFGGQNTAVITSTTISQLPPASSKSNRIIVITDGTSGTDCSTGGGNNVVVCRSNGTSWSALGHIQSGGGSAVPSGAIYSLSGNIGFIRPPHLLQFTGLVFMGRC